MRCGSKDGACGVADEQSGQGKAAGFELCAASKAFNELEDLLASSELRDVFDGQRRTGIGVTLFGGVEDVGVERRERAPHGSTCQLQSSHRSIGWFPGWQTGGDLTIQAL